VEQVKALLRISMNQPGVLHARYAAPYQSSSPSHLLYQCWATDIVDGREDDAPRGRAPCPAVSGARSFYARRYSFSISDSGHEGSTTLRGSQRLHSLIARLRVERVCCVRRLPVRPRARTSRLLLATSGGATRLIALGLCTRFLQATIAPLTLFLRLRIALAWPRIAASLMLPCSGRCNSGCVAAAVITPGGCGIEVQRRHPTEPQNPWAPATHCCRVPAWLTTSTHVQPLRVVTSRCAGLCELPLRMRSPGRRCPIPACRCSGAGKELPAVLSLLLFEC
jgi:hypothetical protein